MEYEVVFVHKDSGRIGVFAKCYSPFGEVETVARIGTIKYCISTKEYLFWQSFMFGLGTKLSKNTMQKISDKLRELDTMKVEL